MKATHSHSFINSHSENGSSARRKFSLDDASSLQLKQNTNLLTITFEDYFQVGSFRHLISQNHWDRFDTRIIKNTHRLLNLLDRHDVKATFFILGWNAKRWPELIRLIAEQGHEVANGGIRSSAIQQHDLLEFREELRQSRSWIEEAAGQQVVGYRVPNGWLKPVDIGLLELLAEEGYLYDSSLVPTRRMIAKTPRHRFPFLWKNGNQSLWEIPPTTLKFMGLGHLLAGGNYLRQFPHALMKQLLHKTLASEECQGVMYFNLWEIDQEQPSIEAASRFTRMRHYRHLGKAYERLNNYLQEYEFTSIADALGIGDQLELSEETSGVISSENEVKVHPVKAQYGFRSSSSSASSFPDGF